MTHTNEILSEWEADGSALVPHTGCWNPVSSQLKATSGSLYSTSSIRLIFQMSSWTWLMDARPQRESLRSSVLLLYVSYTSSHSSNHSWLRLKSMFGSFCFQLSPNKISPYFSFFPLSLSKVFPLNNLFCLSVLASVALIWSLKVELYPAH